MMERTEKEVTRRVANSILETLTYPPKPEHDYQAVPNSYVYVYRLLDTIQNKFEWSGETTFVCRVDSLEIRKLITDHNILSEVGNNTWTLPSYLQDANTINEFLSKYYFTENKPSPITLDDAINLKSCIIATKGYNFFGVISKLADRMEEDEIAFFCPDRCTADEFRSQTDIVAIPERPLRNDPKVLVFCFAHAYSIERLANDLASFTCKSPELWPEKILFFGDPKLSGVQGDSLFQELLDGGRIPTFDFSWQSIGSQNLYSEGIQAFINSLDTTTKSTQLPWSSEVQICSPEKFKELYGQLLASSDPDVYHILSDNFIKIRELEKDVRSCPPNGLHVHDKVVFGPENQIDWISNTWPLSHDGNSMETPKNVAMTNRLNHAVLLNRERYSSHEECCKTSVTGLQYLRIHTKKWATIQTFRDNRVPKRDHIVLLLTEETRKKYLYAAACMATKKLTLVGTLQDIDGILTRPLPQRKPISLIECTVKQVK
jgi:hypothetical protein